MTNSTSLPIDQFPNEPLTKPIGKPTMASFIKIKEELATQLSQVQTARGTGTLGFISLALGDVGYAAIANAGAAAGAALAPVFVPPPNPGPIVQYPQGHTAAIRVTEERAFDFAKAEFTQYNAIHQAAKNLLVECLGDLYLGALKVQYVGYMNVNLFDMLEHVRTNYATLRPMDLANNLTAMHAPWNPDDGLETLLLRIVEGVAYADTGQSPITDHNQTRICIQVLTATGQFAEWIEKWEVRPFIEHTMTNFSLHFEAADHIRRHRTTSGTAGFFQPPPAGRANAATTSTIKYCWTHGIFPNGGSFGHTGLECTNKAPNHNATATFGNMLGGNNLCRRTTGETAIWRPIPRVDRRQRAAGAQE